MNANRKFANEQRLNGVRPRSAGTVLAWLSEA